MAQSTDSNPQLAISPPAIIAICIIGALLILVIAAAISRLCGRNRTVVNEDTEDAVWNPNQRIPEQVQRMQEVRWINNMFAWERAKIARAEIGERLHGSYQQDWLSRVEEQQRARDRGWSVDHSGQESSSGRSQEATEPEASTEFSAGNHNHGNPYHNLLQTRLDYARRDLHFPHSPEKRSLRRKAVCATFKGHGATKSRDSNTSNQVKITINDNPEEFSEVRLNSDHTVGTLECSPGSRSNAEQQSKSAFLRSSSVYSGDALLPMSHLHLLHSGQPASRRSFQALKVHPMIEHWENRNESLS